MTANTVPRPRISQDTRGDLLVFTVVAMMLIAGWVYKNSLQVPALPIADADSGMSLSLPAHWQRDPLATGVIVSASDPRSASFYKAGVSGYSRQIDPQNPLSADQLVDRRVNEQGGAVLAYQLISITPTKVAGADARAVEYAFVDRPIDQPFRAALPVVVHAVDYIIFTPSQYFVITFSADQAEFQNEQEQFQRILKSIRLP